MIHKIRAAHWSNDILHALQVAKDGDYIETLSISMQTWAENEKEKRYPQKTVEITVMKKIPHRKALPY